MIGELQDKNKSPSLSIAFKMGYLLIWPVKRAVYSCKKPSKLGNISSFVGTVFRSEWVRSVSSKSDDRVPRHVSIIRHPN